MEDHSSSEKQCVIFKLGAETFGLDIDKVKEIVLYQEPTRIPGTSGSFEGVINLRGHVIPIVNLKHRFSFSEEEITKNTRIVVIEICDKTVGVVVDKVTEVIMIPMEAVEKPSSIIDSDVGENYITGVAKLDSGLVILLAMEKVLDLEMQQAG